MTGIIVGAKIVGGEFWERKLQKAFEAWARFDVNDHFRDQFTMEKWAYPAVTFRKNRDTAGPGPRDIFDLGDLYRSGRDSFSLDTGINGPRASWDWNATNTSGRLYAYYVHEGVGTNLEARRWTDPLTSPSLFLSSKLSDSLKKRISSAF